MWYGHPFLKAYAPEALLISALQQGQLRGIRDGEEPKAYYWYGKQKIDRDIRFDRDSVLKIWRDDPWSLAQMMIWIVTLDPQQVEDASSSGLDGPWAALIIEQRPKIQVEHAASELTHCCRQGTIQTFDSHSPIKSDAWKDLQIEFLEGVPFVRAYPDIGFSPAGALRQFPPDKKPDDLQETAAGAAELALRRQRRSRIADWFNRRQELIPLERRRWLSLSEIADECAKRRGTLMVDDKEREQVLDVLRRSILAGEFVDTQGRSRVLNLHPSGLAGSRLERLARNVELFRPIAEHLWIRHQHCVDWFKKCGVDLPLRLRREFPPKGQSEARREVTAPRPETTEDCATGEPFPSSDQRGRTQKPPRCIPPGRPLGARGEVTAVTVTWDVMTSHLDWKSNGFPAAWSFNRITSAVNKQLGNMVQNHKIWAPSLEKLRANSMGEYEISETTVKRALGLRRSGRQSSSSAGN